MRDRLIELHEEAWHCWDGYLDENHETGKIPYKTYDEYIADYLLENGVIVPPCKVGDVVYVNPKTWGGLTPLNYDNCFIHSEYFLVAEVVSIIKTRKQNLIKLKVYNRTTYTPEYSRYPISSIGKTVFLTREEAKKALRKLQASYEQVKGGAEQ